VQTAERGKIDFFFLTEGLRQREKTALNNHLDIVTSSDTLTVLAALAAVTDRIGITQHHKLNARRALPSQRPSRVA